MKDTKLYAVGILTLLLLGSFLLFGMVAPQNQNGENSIPPLPPTNTDEPDEISDGTQNEKPENSEDYSIEVTKLDENFVLHYLVNNQSEEEMTFGMHCSFSKLENDEWIPVPLEMIFIEIARILPPDSTAEEKIHLEEFKDQLTSGTYRLEKELYGVLYYDTFSIEAQVPQNTLLPNPNIGQGLPEGAVPWVTPDESISPVGEATTGHNPDNTQWTNWNGIAR